MAPAQTEEMKPRRVAFIVLLLQESFMDSGISFGWPGQPSLTGGTDKSYSCCFLMEKTLFVWLYKVIRCFFPVLPMHGYGASAAR
jgi:hypothetical protein